MRIRYRTTICSNSCIFLPHGKYVLRVRLNELNLSLDYTYIVDSVATYHKLLVIDMSYELRAVLPFFCAITQQLTFPQH